MTSRMPLARVRSITDASMRFMITLERGNENPGAGALASGRCSRLQDQKRHEFSPVIEELASRRIRGRSLT